MLILLLVLVIGQGCRASFYCVCRCRLSLVLLLPTLYLCCLGRGGFCGSVCVPSLLFPCLSVSCFALFFPGGGVFSGGCPSKEHFVSVSAEVSFC